MTRHYRDPLIAFNAGLFWVAILFLLPLALVFYWAYLGPLGIAVSLITFWSFAVPLPLILMLWRPWYPFKAVLQYIEPRALSEDRLRVLSFLVDRRGATRVMLNLSLALSLALLALTTLFVKLPDPFSSPLRPSSISDRLGRLFIVGLLALLSGYGVFVGGTMYAILKRWKIIQSTYTPLDRGIVRARFYIGTRLGAVQGDADLAFPISDMPLRDSRDWRRAISAILWLLAVPTLFYGFIGLARLLLAGPVLLQLLGALSIVAAGLIAVSVARRFGGKS